METKFESRVGKVATSEEKAYTFLSNFNNFKQFIPADKLENYQSGEDHCRFTVQGVGEVGLRIIEKVPYKTIKVSGDGMANQQFYLWIQLKQLQETDTRVKLTLKADLNPMLKMMASKPIQLFLDKLIDAIERIPV
jgi:carbon monoxide dehydrogenase subunit G